MNPVLKVLFMEESTDSIYDFNDSFADSNSLVDRNESAAGAQLWYTLEGADAHLFRVASDETLYKPPDYETPLDVGTQVVDNKYTFNVKVRDNENVPYTEDQVAFEVEVTPLNEAPVINGGVSSFDIRSMKMVSGNGLISFSFAGF